METSNVFLSGALLCSAVGVMKDSKVFVGGALLCVAGGLADLMIPRSQKKALAQKVERLFTTKSQLRKEWGSEAHALADYGDLAGIKAHIAKHPQDVHKRVDGREPIHVAASYKHRQIVEFLLEKGAKVNVSTHNTVRTPLHLAFENNDIPLIEYLLSKGADIYARNIWGDTPLEGGSLSVAKQFFKHFDFMTWFNGALPIHDYAIYRPQLAIAILSKECGINVPCPRYNQATALHLAVAKGYQNLARELITYGAQLDAQDASGNTPLHVALNKGKDTLVRELMKGRARIDIRNHKGRTPLDLAKQRYNFNEELDKQYYVEQNTPWKEVVLGRRGEDGDFLEEQEFSYLMDSKTKDLYEVEASSTKLKFKAVLLSALAPLYLPLSVIRQIGALALDIARVVKDIFLRIRSYGLVDTLIIRPCREMACALTKRIKHVVMAPLCCAGLIFAGLYTQYDQNEGRKWMNRMAESWDESRLLKPFSLAKVGNLNMTLIGKTGKREFQEV